MKRLVLGLCSLAAATALANLDGAFDVPGKMTVASDDFGAIYRDDGSNKAFAYCDVSDILDEDDETYGKGEIEIRTTGPGTITCKWKAEISSGECNLWGPSVSQKGGAWQDVAIPVYGQGTFGLSVDVWGWNNKSPKGFIEFCDFAFTPAPETMTVTFNANGGTCEAAPYAFSPGDSYGVRVLPVPSRAGYDYLGWFENDEFGRMAREKRHVPLRETVTLVAKWANQPFAFLPGWTVNSGHEWRSVVMENGETVFEAPIAKLGGVETKYYYDYDEEKDIAYLEPIPATLPLTVTPSEAGFLSFEASTVRGYYDDNEYPGRDSYASLTVYLDGKEVAWIKGRDWTTKRIYLPAGHELKFVAKGLPPYEWIDDDKLEPCGEPAYVRIKNLSFEPVGPQKDFASWNDKLRDYTSWVTGDLARFANDYAARIAKDSNDYEARIFHAVTLLASLAENEVFNAALATFGVHFDYARLTFLGTPTFGAGNAQPNDMADKVLAIAEPAFKTAMADLEAIPASWAETVKLAASTWHTDEDVYIDAADVMFARASLDAMLGMLYFAAAYDATLDWTKIAESRFPDVFRHAERRAELWARFFREQTAFLSSIRNRDRLATAGAYVKSSLSKALAADQTALARGNDGKMHFVEYDPRLNGELALARDCTRKMLASLDARTTIDCAAIAETYVTLCLAKEASVDDDIVRFLTAVGSVDLYLGVLFANGVTTAMLPPLRAEAGFLVPNYGLMPDPTLGGLLPGFTRERWAALHMRLAPQGKYDWGNPAPVSVVPESVHVATNEAVPVEKAAAEYNGFLKDASGKVVGSVKLKVAKANKKTGASKVTGTVQLGAKKAKVTGIYTGGVFTAKDFSDVVLDKNGISGKYGAYTIDGSRNVFTAKNASDKASAAAAMKAYKGAYTVAWQDGGLWGGVTVTVGNKGKTKIVGFLPNGTKVGANGQLMLGDGSACVTVVSTNKKTPLAFNLWLTGGAAVVDGLGADTQAAKVGALSSGKSFTCSLLGAAVPVTVAGKKWSVTTDKATALKLSFTPKTGAFKGSFKVGKQKATVNGVVVNGVGYGSAVIKKGAKAAATIK